MTTTKPVDDAMPPLPPAKHRFCDPEGEDPDILVYSADQMHARYRHGFEAGRLAASATAGQAAAQGVGNNHAEIRRLAGLALDQPEKYNASAVLTRIHRLATTPQPPQAEPAHSDHPMRHYDRTCPACNFEPAQAAPVGEMTDEEAQVVVGKVEEMVGYGSQAWDIVGPCDLARAFAAALSAKPVQQDAGVTDEVEHLVKMKRIYQIGCDLRDMAFGVEELDAILAELRKLSGICPMCEGTGIDGDDGDSNGVGGYAHECSACNGRCFAMLSTPPRICGSEPSSSAGG